MGQQRMKLGGRLIASLAVSVGVAAVSAEAATLYVPSVAYHTIQEAVNAAKPGDTIQLSASSSPYRENVTVTRSFASGGQITIRGDGDPAFTRIEGQIEFHPTGAAPTRKILTLQKLTIRRPASLSNLTSSTGVFYSNSSNHLSELQIIDCVIERHTIGIKSDIGQQLTVVHTLVRNNTDGIVLSRGNAVRVQRSVLSRNRNAGLKTLDTSYANILIEDSAIVSNGRNPVDVVRTGGVWLEGTTQTTLTLKRTIFSDNHLNHIRRLPGLVLSDGGGNIYLAKSDGQAF